MSISSIDTGQASIAMEPRPTRIYVNPAASIRPRSMLASVFSLGAQHAAGNRPRSERTRVPVTRGAARSGSRMRLPRRLGIEEERAGGGAGPEPPIRAASLDCSDLS